MTTTRELLQQRLHNQHLSQTEFEKPEDVVGWLGAVQSQDYAGGKWALGLRALGVTDDQIEQAFSAGTILRTHVMRPTWHFVLPADIRWMLELTAPRVNALMATYYRKLELDATVFARINDTLVKALEGGKQFTRAELVTVLQQANILKDTDDALRFTYCIASAELEGLICSGGRRGKQFTYALLDERAPQARTLERDEALAELARRFFTSHGPAALKDYVWWSGLTVADAKAGLEMVQSQLVQEEVDRQTYWLTEPHTTGEAVESTAYLLPNYDEYIVGYTDRSAIFDAQHAGKLDSRGNFLFNNTVVVEGQVVGTWRRTFKAKAAVLEFTYFVSLNAHQEQAVAAAAQRYGTFLGMPVQHLHAPS